MSRCRPPLGYEYKVLVIQTDGKQVQKTPSFGGYTPAHVRHAEAMKVFKQTRSIRDAGCVVRMLRYAFGETHPLDWSDDGTKWRPFETTGREFNETIAAVRDAEGVKPMTTSLSFPEDRVPADPEEDPIPLSTFRVGVDLQYGPVTVELKAITSEQARERVERIIAGGHYGIMRVDILGVERVEDET